MRPSLLLVLLAAGAGCLNPCAPVPPSNACHDSTRAVLSSLALGPGNPYDDTTPFRSWSEGDGVPVIEGTQGAHMIVARLEAVGSAGDCLAQETVVRDEQGNEIAADRAPVLSQPAVGASGAPIPNTTDTYAIFLPGVYPPPGAHLVVTATAGGRSVTHTLVILSPGTDLSAARDLAPSDLASGDGP